MKNPKKILLALGIYVYLLGIPGSIGLSRAFAADSTAVSTYTAAETATSPKATHDACVCRCMALAGDSSNKTDRTFVNALPEPNPPGNDYEPSEHYDRKPPAKYNAVSEETCESIPVHTISCQGYGTKNGPGSKYIERFGVLSCVWASLLDDPNSGTTATANSLNTTTSDTK